MIDKFNDFKTLQESDVEIEVKKEVIAANFLNYIKSRFESDDVSSYTLGEISDSRIEVIGDVYGMFNIALKYKPIKYVLFLSDLKDNIAPFKMYVGDEVRYVRVGDGETNDVYGTVELYGNTIY